MGYAIGVIVMAVGILLSIALHEVGHMVPAKKFGVRVPQYFVGFGRTLWSRTKGETEYGVKAIPLGGYVRLVGMYPPAPAGAKPRTGRIADLVQSARDVSLEEIRPGEEHRAFYHLSVPKKVIVMMGGPLMNLLIAAVLLTITQVGFGSVEATTTLSSVAPCLAATPGDTSCESGANSTSPAAKAGLQAGDRIVSIDGTAVSTWAEVTTAITAAGANSLNVVVDRAGASITTSLTPQMVTQQVTAEDGTTSTVTSGKIGISPSTDWASQPLSSVPKTMWDQLSSTAKVVVTLPARVIDVAKATFGGEQRDDNSVVSVVGVGRIAGEVAAEDTSGYPANVAWVQLLSLLASLNIALFAFNMIPLPPLDGGHIAGALYEGARRQIARLRGRTWAGPADTARLVPVAYVSFVALTAMGLLLIYADIVKPVQLG